MMTLSAERRHAVLATSMAVFPPPTTTTVPFRGALSKYFSRRKSMPLTIPSVSNSPGTFMGLPAHAPAETKTASWLRRTSSKDTSRPTVTDVRISAPARQMKSISLSSTSSGSRYSGMP